MSCNESYSGVNALFQLLIDKNKADSAAAAAYLKAFEEAMNQPTEPIEEDSVDLSVDVFMEKLTPENIGGDAVPVESTRQICTIDKKRMIHYSYKMNNTKGNGAVSFDTLFPDNKTGISPTFNYDYSEDGLADLCIDVFMRNDDGTVTYVVYQSKNV